VHWLEKHMIPAYPLGELVTPEKKAGIAPETGERA
jgi:hypothetical protein